MKYIKNTETKIGRTYKVVMVSQEYVNCKKDVDKLCGTIKRLMSSLDGVLTEIVNNNTAGQLQEKYKHCLRHTIMIALDDVDKLIQQHNVTGDEEIDILRETITKLLDDVEKLFN